MALSETAPRSLTHQRRIEIQGFRRDDGLWDIEGHLRDIRPAPMSFPGGVRAAGESIHSMRVRLTIDDDMLIVGACADTDAAPYESACAAITTAYQQLVGLRIGAGFRRSVQQLFGDERGCSHITELIGAMAAGAVQTLSRRSAPNADEMPFQIGKCHALVRTGTVVEEHYPRWYLKSTP